MIKSKTRRIPRKISVGGEAGSRASERASEGASEEGEGARERGSEGGEGGEGEGGRETCLAMAWRPRVVNSLLEMSSTEMSS